MLKEGEEQPDALEKLNEYLADYKKVGYRLTSLPQEAQNVVRNFLTWAYEREDLDA